MDIEYSAKMVTNGYLLTSDVSEKLEQLAVRNIQITLDGSESVS